MKLERYQVDAFTNEIFGGNPACVVPLQEWLPDELLLNIAKENAVPETAFFVHKGEKMHLRWFTPDLEMDLCGHATLATAHCLYTMLNYGNSRMVFETLSGDLEVVAADGYYNLDFPSRMPVASALPEPIEMALSIKPLEVLKARDYVLVYNSENDIRNIEINRRYFDQVNLGHGGVIVTARGIDCDFVSRFFTPQATILEDPVTGSAHCSLIPFWAQRLGKNEMFAMQLSDRVGKLKCLNKADRVIISGQARTYSAGWLYTE